MVGNSAEPSRTLHIVGTKGEVFGTMEQGSYTLRRIAPGASGRSTTEEFTVSGGQDMHGGGDLRLVADFVNVLRGNPPSISTTALEDSINGHLIGFAAEQGRHEGRWVTLDELRAPAAATAGR